MMSDQRLLFSKCEDARYISHLDLMRTFQRAFQRAGLAIKHTEGFNPHAFVSIALPLSVGFSSACEILEFGLLDSTPQESVPKKLNKALPKGIVVHECYDAVRKVKELCYVNYIVTMEYESGLPVGAETAVRELIGQDQLVVTKKSKKSKTGETKVDLIPLIQRATVESRRDMLALDLVVSAQNPGLNPELICKAVRERYPEFTPDFTTFHRKEILDRDGKVFR